MIDLIRLAIEKPMNAIIVALCTGTIYMHFATLEIQKVQAAILVRQEEQNTSEDVKFLIKQVTIMNENLNFVKATQVAQVKYMESRTMNLINEYHSGDKYEN